MATTPNYSLSIYNSSDTDVRFLDFRVAIAGTQATSNFYVIDGALKEHSDAINTLKNSPQAYIVKANFASGIYNANVSGFTGYKANQLIVLSLNQTNTGAVSININNSSAKNVMLYNANGILRNFIAGEFVSNSPALCYYDGTQFVTIGIPRGSATYVDGERGDVLQISSDGAIESSGKQIGNPNGIAALDSGGKVEQIAKVSDSAASGEAVYNGNSIEIPYVSENRIASITAYGETPQGGTTEAPVALTGISSITVNDDVAELPIPRPLRRVGDVKDKCVTRQEHEGAEKLVVTYNVGYIESYAGENITTAWISSTGALSTGAEVAYVLSSPETYAADPLDIDNAAGPLTVLTGGELEVKLNDFISASSTSFKNKLDKNGDGSNVTAAFTEAAQDADIASGEKLSVLFGKIKKRLSLLKSIASNRSELDNDYFLHSVNQRGVSGTISTAGYFIDRWKLVSGSVTLSADGLQLAAGTVIAQILEYAAGTDVIASLGIASGTASAAYDNATKTYTITATTACTLIWAKLEKSSVATPYVPKGYGSELAECQRYYLRVPTWQLLGSGYVQYDGALIVVMMPTPCTMRTNPSINSISGTFYFGDGTTSSYTGTPGVVSRPGWAAISFTGTFGHQNQTVAFLLSGSTVELSADL